MRRSLRLRITRWPSCFHLWKIAPVVLAVMASPIAAAAEDPALPPKRLTVGVALESGGALGLAHIGVLRWLNSTIFPSTISPEIAWALWWAACM